MTAKALYAWAILIGYLIAAIILLCLFRAHPLYTLLLLVAFEYLARCYRQRRIYLPFANQIKKHAAGRGKTAPQPPQETAEAIPAPPARTEKERAPLVTSISVLTLRDFKKCTCDGDLTVLGDGTPAELSDAWAQILSQYYTILEDPNINMHNKLRKRIALLQLRRKKVLTLAELIENGIYSPVFIEHLKAFYKFPFTAETMEADIRKVKSGEIRTKIDIDTLYKDLNKMTSGKEESPAEKRKTFVRLLMDINKIEGCKYDDTITVEMFAMGLKRREEYINNLTEKSFNNGRG